MEVLVGDKPFSNRTYEEITLEPQRGGKKHLGLNFSEGSVNRSNRIVTWDYFNHLHNLESAKYRDCLPNTRSFFDGFLIVIFFLLVICVVNNDGCCWFGFWANIYHKTYFCGVFSLTNYIFWVWV